MKKYYIYTNEKTPKLLDFVRVLRKEQLSQAFKGYDEKFHIVSEEKFDNPILENLKLREMTDTEIAENGRRDLVEGEKLLDGALITVDAPDQLHSWDFETLDWKYDEVKKELMLESIRHERNQLIAATDYMMLADSPLTSEQKQEIEAYRKALRDVPENMKDVNPIWPEKPKWIK